MENVLGYSVLSVIGCISALILFAIYLWDIKKKNIKKSKIIIFGIIFLLLFINAFIMRPVYIEGDSMKPTFGSSRIIFINLLNHSPKRYDIAVIKKKNIKFPIIKRICAMPGETVEIKNGDLYIDNKEVKSLEFKIIKDDYTMKAIKVPKNCYFVLGDNRPLSLDSRYHEISFVNKKEIVGVIFGGTK